MLNQEERSMLEKLIYASEKNPSMPAFPVTRTYKISVPGFKNVWLKDESTNETGTHKDRMAWEIVMTYKDILLAKQQGLNGRPLPHLSIISAGSAALAVQNQLRKYSLPNLRALIDNNTSADVIGYLKSIGVKVYKTDLAEKPLSPSDILELTDNPNGFDITSNQAFDPDAHFYDWMGLEILNHDPDKVFIPFGTGQLFENIVSIARQIVTGQLVDSNYTGDPKKISDMDFIGATTSNPETKAVKLYAPFRPFTSASEAWVRLNSQRGWCGTGSRIVEVREESIEAAYNLLTRQKIPVEHSAAAGMAALFEINDPAIYDQKILIVSTGKVKAPID